MSTNSFLHSKLITITRSSTFFFVSIHTFWLVFRKLHFGVNHIIVDQSRTSTSSHLIKPFYLIFSIVHISLLELCTITRPRQSTYISTQPVQGEHLSASLLYKPKFRLLVKTYSSSPRRPIWDHAFHLFLHFSI